MSLPSVACFRQMDIIDQLTALYEAILQLSSGSFSPDQILGLEAWYKDTGIEISEGGVNAWNDASGNANHLTSLLTGIRPTTGTLNEITVVNFTFDGDIGQTISMDSPLLSGSAATIFVVMNKDGAVAADSGGWITDFNFSNHHPLSSLEVRDGSFSSAQKNCGPQVVSIPDNWRIFSIRSQDNDFRVEVDGQTQFTTGTNTFSNGDLFLIGAGGCDAGLTPSFFLQGSIAEVIVYGVFLSDAQRDAVITYLRNRFNL